jgi:hypothetical protein
MQHTLRASSMIRTFAHRSMSESARNCCAAMNLHKAIALPNPYTVSPNRPIHTAPYRQTGNRTAPRLEHCRYGTRDLASSQKPSSRYRRFPLLIRGTPVLSTSDSEDLLQLSIDMTYHRSRRSSIAKCRFLLRARSSCYFFAPRMDPFAAVAHSFPEAGRVRHFRLSLTVLVLCRKSRTSGMVQRQAQPPM